MPRPPFDPSEIPRPPRSTGPARRERRQFGHVGEAERLTVGELAGLIKTTLEERIASPLRVIGQVSNLSRPGHWYFSLKDEDAVVSCVAWASSARKFGFTPGDGDEVVATGHVSHYPPQGRTQFYVTALEPVGAGALQLRFQALCEELRGLGYFDPERKKPLPVFPRRVAVITSATGAAVHDVRATAAQRCRAVGLVLVNVRVQGDEASGEVARAIRWVDANRDRLGVDAILVTRGGGAVEDLWAFNERPVADAAFACGLPLVAAIGHESDTTVIELVADHRAATPTQAAMALVPAADALARQLDHLGDRLGLLVRRRHERGGERVGRLADMLARVVRQRLIEARLRLERAAARLAHVRPERLVAHRHERLAVLRHRLAAAIGTRVAQRPRIDALGARLDAAVARRIEVAGARLRAAERELAAIDPRRVLRRGFSYTTDARGEVVRSVAQVRPGDAIRSHLTDGAIDSVVGGARRRRRPKPGEDDQMDLFGGNE